MYSIIAIKILALTYLARINPEASCETILEKDDVEDIILCHEQNKGSA